ncbi:hypothetical protein I4U23_010972 [Adineta vaga]|nr:hypothetical protein I4U23_010972 [Adineta vaga]
MSQIFLNNNTFIMKITLRNSDSIIVTLEFIKQNFIIYLPLILTIFVFLPQLSENLLILCTIDRYAGTRQLTSSIRRLRQLKMVPYLIAMSLYDSTLYDIDSILNTILYITIQGIITLFTMLSIVLLTYKNIRLSRQHDRLTNENLHHPQNYFSSNIMYQV